MNGEIPSVPITTLAGVSSLVDLLPEMPLPSPLPQTLSNKSLLFHPRVAEEAQRLLAINDDNLIPQLVHSLSQTSSKHIDLKDQFIELPVDHQHAPTLLSVILMRRPDVFNGMIEHNVNMNMNWGNSEVAQQQGQQHQMSYGVNSMTGLSQPQHHQQHGPNPNAHHMGHLGSGIPPGPPHHMHNSDGGLQSRMNAGPGVHMGNLDMGQHKIGQHMNNDTLHSRGRPLPPTFNSISAMELESHHPHQFNSDNLAGLSSPRGRPPQPPPQMNIPMSMNMSMNMNDLDPLQSIHKMYNKDTNSLNSRGPAGLEINMVPVPQKLTPVKQQQLHQQQQQQDNNTSVLSLHSVFQDSSEMLNMNFNVPVPTSSSKQQQQQQQQHQQLTHNIMGFPGSTSTNTNTNPIPNDLLHPIIPPQIQVPLKMSLKENLQMSRVAPPPVPSTVPVTSAMSTPVPQNTPAQSNVMIPVPVQIPAPVVQNSFENFPVQKTPTKRKEDISSAQGLPPTAANLAMNMPRVELKPLPLEFLAQHQAKGNNKTNLSVNLGVQSKCTVKIEANDRVQQHLKKLEKNEVPSTPQTPPNNRVVGRTSSRNYHESTSEEEDSENESRKAKKGKIFKTKTPEKRKRSERRSGEIDLTITHPPGMESKRRRSSNVSGGTGEESNPEDSPKKKVRRVERMLVPVLEKLGGNILDNNTYHRFLKTMDIVLDNMEYIDKNEVDLDDDGNVPPELLIPKHQLNELCSEAAKLKALGAMEAIPSDKIVRLLTLLEKNIRDGSRVTPLADPDDNEDESRLWLELTMESITRGVLASLTALHILTSQNMPKRAYLEDLIDRIVLFTKFQLQNTIYPSFDPVYRVDPKGKDGFSSSKKKRAHARGVREKSMISFYNKIHEVVGLLAELLNVQILTDTTVLHLSTLGVAPFFVESVSELQLSALKLVTCVFTQYDKHRRLLLDDILASIARLPSSKRSLRTFRLASGSEEYIQMLTALVLQLIQCVTFLPDKLESRGKRMNSEMETDFGKEKPSNSDRDMMIGARFDTAMRTAGNFLTVFLSKCGSKSEDCDYRILFENFIQDLLSTVNKPQWPASELLLSLLGSLLVKNLGNKSLEVTMRVASLEYLGVAASRLRKDAVSAQVKMKTIDRIIADIKAEDEEISESDPLKEPEPGTIEHEESKTEFLQRLLLDYLAVHGQSDPALMHARHFYISSWWKSAPADIAKSIRGNKAITPSSKQNRAKKKKKKKGESSEEESVSEESDQEAEVNEKETEINSKVLEMTEQRKSFLLTKIRPFSDPIASRKTEVVQTFVDYQSAELVTRYLASKRPFSASFDFFLTRILSVSTEQTVAIRTKALKCLTMVVEADPSVLARQDMQMWVQNSFLDQSTAVREAAVDLVGKYVLSCHDLIDQYYEMLSLRILDTGVSVRKRVIKILRDICVECPQFPKIPEICVKMIRRVNDEDGIRKLVMEVFQNMWFTPVKEEPLDTGALLRKVSHITDVVASCEKVGLDFFEQLLLSLFKPKDEREDVREKAVNLEPPKAVVTASQQIVNCLVEHVLRIEEGTTIADGQQQQQQSLASQRFVACVATLFLFAKIRPQLLVNHANTLEGYLTMKCQNLAEVAAIANIANILELVVPLLVNPAESFLVLLEEDCVKLSLKNEKTVLDSCLACLGAVVNKITGNYRLVRDVFRRFQSVLMSQTMILRGNAMDARLNDNRPLLRRAVYTIGLLLRYFDFTRPDVYGEFSANIVESVFHELLYLLETPGSDLQYFSLQAIGNLCIRHYDFMLGNDLKKIYQQLLTESAEIKLKIQALSNIQLYLVEEELRMIKQDQEWKKNAKLEDLKEMGDVNSGMASTIVQIYLKQILEAFLNSELGVRLAAVRVVQLVLQQGLVHPIQIVPYLICMSTDEEQGVSATADKQLQEMEKKHPQFLQSQVLNGIRLSLQLQRILQGYKGLILPGGFSSQQGSQSSQNQHLEVDPDLPIVRGYRIRPKEAPSALNGFLYSLLRSTKPQRRAIALSLLKQFDEQNKNRLADLLYYADNLAYFPYQVVDEPLFLIHHVDIVISVTGSNLLQAFKESLVPLPSSKPPVPVPVMNPMEVENPEQNPMNLEILPPVMDIMPVPEAPVVTNKVSDIMEDDEDEDIDSLLRRIPENTKTLEEFTIRSQGCLLLLMLKQHLKDTYAITDTRISGYSPSDATKAYERPVTRRNTHVFDPKCTIANLKIPPSGETLENRRALVEQYLHFKQLMLRIDPEDGEEDGESKPVTVKIDQNLFTYPKARVAQPQPRHGRSGSTSEASFTSPPGATNRETRHGSPHAASHYVVVSQPVPSTPGTPVAKVEPIVRVPKLTIVPLKFPGDARKTHKVKEHHHHNKHKKSKHKKKKRHTVSDDDDSDNPDSDPDFRL